MEASLKRKIIYVGLDVDNTQYHGSALGKNICEVDQVGAKEILISINVQPWIRISIKKHAHNIILCNFV